MSVSLLQPGFVKTAIFDKVYSSFTDGGTPEARALYPKVRQRWGGARFFPLSLLVCVKAFSLVCPVSRFQQDVTFALTTEFFFS